MNHRLRDFTLQTVDLTTGVASSTIPAGVTYQTGIFSVTAESLDDSHVGYWKMRLSATARDTTGADTNTQAETVDFYVVIYQIFTYALAD